MQTNDEKRIAELEARTEKLQEVVLMQQEMLQGVKSVLDLFQRNFEALSPVKQAVSEPEIAALVH